MTEKQIELIMQIVREQLDDYLDEELAGRFAAGIEEGINDNSWQLGGE